MTTTSPGHLFLVHADVRHLVVDAWILPTDRRGSVTRAWSKDEAVLAERISAWSASVRSGGVPTERVQILPSGVAEGPLVVACAIPVAGTVDPGYHLESVREAVALVRQERSRDGSRLRIGLPALGIGASGGASVKGEVLAGFLRGLRAVVVDLGVDLVLTLDTAEATSAARHVRRGEDAETWWPALSADDMAQVHRLADLAVAGRLALFTGAGTSRGAGLPTWKELVRGLEEDAAATDGVLAAEEGTSSLEGRAAAVAHVLGNGLGRAVGDRLASDGYSLQHALLANLPVRHAVTTNYDRLLEDAASDAGRSFAVLPYEAAGDRRWLLKLHGHLDASGEVVDLVLTEEHYEAAATHRATLTGLVQAVLATEHLLFVGFSLSDEHVTALVNDVRTAMGTGHGQFGTALMVGARSGLAESWHLDVEVVTLTRPEGEDAGRHLEIFLDALADAADPMYLHLGDPTWSGTLDEDEKALAALLQDLREVVGRHPGAAWQRLRDALSAYGHR